MKVSALLKLDKKPSLDDPGDIFSYFKRDNTKGKIMKRSIFLAAALCILSNIAYSSIEKTKFSSSGLKKLKLNSTAGNVKVSVSKDGNAYVNAKKLSFDKHCKLKIERSGHELEVKLKNDSNFMGINCEVEFEVKLPNRINLDVAIGSGDFSVRGINGKIEFNLGSGNNIINANSAKIAGKSGSGSANIAGTIAKIDLITGSGNVKTTGSIASLDIRSGSGSIDVSGLTGEAKLKIGSGDAKVQYKSVPPKGELKFNIGSGDSSILLPQGAKIRSDLKSWNGQILNEIADSVDAEFKVSVKAGSGDIKLKNQ